MTSSQCYDVWRILFKNDLIILISSEYIVIAILSNIWPRGLIILYLDKEGHLYDKLSEVAAYKIDNTFCN